MKLREKRWGNGGREDESPTLYEKQKWVGERSRRGETDDEPSYEAKEGGPNGGVARERRTNAEKGVETC